MDSGNAIHCEQRTSIPHVATLTQPAFTNSTVSGFDSGEQRPPTSHIDSQARPNCKQYRACAINSREQGKYYTKTHNSTTSILTQHRQKSFPRRHQRRQSRQDRWHGYLLHKDSLLKYRRFHQGYNKFKDSLAPTILPSRTPHRPTATTLTTRIIMNPATVNSLLSN